MIKNQFREVTHKRLNSGYKYPAANICSYFSCAVCLFVYQPLDVCDGSHKEAVKAWRHQAFYRLLLLLYVVHSVFLPLIRQEPPRITNDMSLVEAAISSETS